MFYVAKVIIFFNISQKLAEKYNYTAYFFSIFSKFPYFW